jgi:hypothetical protein
MSFQGDVAGIGLGELLQGLARGGRDGVLNLYSDHISGCLGIRGGMLFLMPGPDEDEETWRDRSLCAWADDPKPLMETRRREAIARAHRLETFYRLLDARNLHFRFDPGPLPKPRSGDEGEAYGQGMPVEYMLLEFARLTDESKAPGLNVEEYDIPRAIDPGRFPPDVRDFLLQCDGRSTLQEIADRLGWPLRQCRGHVLEHYKAKALRLAQPRELLAAGQHELAAGRVGRAAARLSGWVRSSHPGPPSLGDAELFVSEWRMGRLPLVLTALRPRDARAILRKLDKLHADPAASFERWRRLATEHRKDDLSVLHAAALQVASSNEPDTAAFMDLLRLARAFQEAGHPRRTRTLLRLASVQLPSKAQTRIELGRRMLETGLLEEGVRWLLDVARELIGQNDGERAIAPIRTVLKKLPDHTQAHGLLIEARALIARQKRRRWKSVVVLSVVLLFSMVGLVHLKVRNTERERREEIERSLSQPDQALELLARYFPEDSSADIELLRSRILSAKRDTDEQRRRIWTERYEDISQECEYGDPLLGLKRALELQAPPEIETSRPWPTRMDLLGILTARIEKRQRELNVSPAASMEELHAEERLQALLLELTDLTREHQDEAEVGPFFFRLQELYTEIGARRESRAVERDRQIQEQINQEQDLLLGAARAHAAAGDLERAVATYERLSQTQDFAALVPILGPEIEGVRGHFAAVQEAERLAELGDHVQAVEALKTRCPNPREHLLPWRVTTIPPGGRTKLPSGDSRVAPFRTYSSPGDAVDLTFELPGFEPHLVHLDNPRDLVVYLNQQPERRMDEAHRVQALPVPVGDDHIVADRKGRVVRLDAASNLRWTRILETLGGIARTPVFLPRRPGHLLLISEDARAWILDAATGAVEGPLDLSATPLEGPTLTRNGVWLRLKDERIAIWQDALSPTYHDPGSPFFQDGRDQLTGVEAAPTSFTFLRSTTQTVTKLSTPTTGWTVEVRDDHYMIRGQDGRGFTARKSGIWEFVAWEAPKALLPRGRLWVSDEDGLRCYRPDQGTLLTYE